MADVGIDAVKIAGKREGEKEGEERDSEKDSEKDSKKDWPTLTQKKASPRGPPMTFLVK